MYEFHYNYIKTKCNASLLFTDTSSLLYETETGDVYEDKRIRFFDHVNTKVIGKMNDKFK